ncbi:MAG: hypothetical protein OEW05_08740 [Candidatus Aminicenantes bacterium]|nr:hypothetical protein [Candidatus Aminicenantes bacterium]
MTRVQKGIVLVLVLAIVAALAVLADALLFKPLEHSLVKLVWDDAGYYFNISRNFCLGYGFTFDRINETNGFNPLFFLFLISLYKIFLSPTYPILACYRIGVGTTYVAFVLSAWLFYLLVKTLVRRIFQAGEFQKQLLIFSTVLVYVVSFCFKPMFGLDGVFVLLILNLYGLLVLKRGLLSPSPGAWVLDGALLGAVFLARVDSLVLLVTTYVILLVLARRSRADLAGVLVRIASTALVISPFIIYAYDKFGTWLPVSAKIKTTFPVLNIVGSFRSIFKTGIHRLEKANFFLTFLIATAIVIFALVYASRRRKIRLQIPSERLLLVVLSFYLCGRLLFMFLFSRTDIQLGFAIYSIPFNLLAGIMGLNWLKQRDFRPAKIPYYSLALLFLSAGVYGNGLVNSAEVRKIYATPDNELRLTEVVRAMTTPEDVIYGGAFGVAGFLADRKWINGDGVVNTYEYYRILRSGDKDALLGYLRKNEVKYVIYTAPWEFEAKRVLHSQRLLERDPKKVYYFIELADPD